MKDNDYLLAKQFHLNTKNFEKKIIKEEDRSFEIATSPKKILKKEIIPVDQLVESDDSLYKALMNRESYRTLDIRVPINLTKISTLLQLSYLGRNNNTNHIITVPSAGGRYSSSIYLLSFNVMGIEPAVYYWDPFERHLALIKKGDVRKELKEGLLDAYRKEADSCSFAILLTSNINQTCSKYGDRGYRFVCLDVGYISQNLYLTSNHLNLATRAIGGFYDNVISKIIPNNGDEIILVHLFGKEMKSIGEQLEMDIDNYFN